MCYNDVDLYVAMAELVSTTAEQNLTAEMGKVSPSRYEIFPNMVAEITMGF